MKKKPKKGLIQYDGKAYNWNGRYYEEVEVEKE